MSEVKLSYDGNDYKLYCSTVSVSWNNKNIAKPNANGDSVVEVQTQSFENPTYTLRGVHLINEGLETSGVLTYNDLLTLAKVKYTSANPITLTFTYSSSGSTEVLRDSEGATSGIKVVISSFNFPIAVEDKYDDGSNQYYVPVGSITLMETA